MRTDMIRPVLQLEPSLKRLPKRIKHTVIQRRRTVADPGFSVGEGRRPRREGCQLPRWLRFEKFVCQN